jgi:arylsulfatase A-like enzyme
MPPINILLLQGEDMGCHLGCYGDPCARTPNLDRLAAEGVRFTNAFTHAPVCAPSRGGMISGCYPWSIGNHPMRCSLRRPPRCFTEDLRDAGYFVNWPTKLDFNFDPAPGWCDEQSPWWEQPAPRQPFFLYQNFQRTHESRMFPDIPDWHGPLPDCARHLPPTDPADVPVPPYLTDSPELRTQLVRYYDAVASVDAEVGARLRWLDEQGLRDNTLVIFLSDHGRGLPREKRWCYDAGLHLPLILRHPRLLPPGGVRDDLVAWVDLAPTLLSLAGCPVPKRLQGQVVLGDSADPRDCVFAGRDRMDEVYDRVRAVRDKRWHYIRNFAPSLPWAQRQSYMEEQPIVGLMRARQARGLLQGGETVFFQPHKPAEELYDAENDPAMLHNLAEDPACADILRRMRERLAEHLRSVGDLAERSEEELIDQGILTDQLAEYRARILPQAPVPTTLQDLLK